MRAVRVVRVTLKAIGYTLLGIIGLVGLALLVLHTGWGKEQVRLQAVKAINGAITGTISIGKIEGFFFDHITIRDLELLDASGRRAIHADAVSVEYDLLPLLSKEVVVDSVRLEGPGVLAVTEADGALNLAKLAKPSDEPSPPPDPNAEPWTIQVALAVIENGDFSYVQASGSTIAVSGIGLEAGGRLSGDDAQLDLVELSAHLADPELDLRLSALASKTKEEARVQRLELALQGEPALSVRDARYGLVSGHLEAALATSLSADVLRRVTGDQGWRSGATLSGKVLHEDHSAPWHARLDGHVAEAPMTLTATATSDFSGAVAHLDLTRLNPASIHEAGPAGALAFSLDADVQGQSLDDLRGKVALHGGGRVRYDKKQAELTVDRLSLHAEADRGRIDARLEAATSEGQLRAKGILHATETPMRLEKGSVHANFRDFGALLPPKLRIRGKILADIQADGALDDLSARGLVRASKLRFGDTKIFAARIRADVTGVPKSIGGALDVDVRGIEQAELQLGDVDLTARFDAPARRAKVIVDARKAQMAEMVSLRAEVKQLDHAIELAIHSLRARTEGIRWKMNGAYVSLEDHGTMRVRNVRLRSNAGEIDLDATMDTKRLLRGPGKVELSMRKVSLPKLRSAFAPEAPKVRGTMHGKLSAELGKAGPELSLAAEIRDLRWGAARQPLATRLQVDAEGPEIHAAVTAWGRRLGQVTVKADAKIPGNPTDPASWQKLDERAIERAVVRFEKLAVAEVASLLQQPGEMGGIIDGEIELIDGGQEIRTDLFARALRFEPVRAPLELKILTHTTKGRITSEISATVTGRPAIGALLSIEHDAEKIRREGLKVLADADLSGKIRLDELPLELLSGASAAVAQVDEEAMRGTRAVRRSAKGKVTPISTLQGLATMALDFHRKNGEASAKIELRGKDLIWANGAPKLDTELVAEIGEGRLVAKGFGRGATVGSLELDLAARVPRDVFDPKGWEKIDERALRKLWVEFKDLELEGVDKMMSGALKMRGQINGKIVVKDRFEEANVYLSMRGIKPEKMEDVVDGELLASIDGAGMSLVLGAFHQDRQIVDAKLEAATSIDALMRGGEKAMQRARLQGNLRMDRLPMPLVAQIIRSQHDLKGSFTATVAFAGSIAQPIVHLDLTGDGAQIDEYTFHEFSVKGGVRPERFDAKIHIREGKYGKLDLTARLGRGFDDVPVRARLQAHRFRLGWITALLPPTGGIGGIAGRLDAGVNLTGELGNPMAKGKIELRNFKLGLAPPMPMLQRTKMWLTMDGRQVELKVDGHSGDGDIQAELTADLKRLDAPNFDARITTDDLPIAAGPKRLLIDSVTRVKGRTDDKMRIEVVVEDGEIEMPNEGSEQLQEIREFDDVRFVGTKVPDPVPQSKGMPMEISIGLRKPIPIQGKEVNATADAELNMDNSTGEMLMSGYASVGNGYLTVFGKRWMVQKARLDFIPGEEPHIDVELTHDFQTAVVYIKLSGSPSNPDLTLSSDPAIYDEAQLLTFVLGSGPNEDPNNSSMQQQAAGAAASALIGQVQSKLEDELPIDTMQLDFGDGAKVSRLTLGKWISSRLFLGYDYHFQAEEDENVSEGLLQYRLGRGWLIETRYGDRGNGGVDALWVKRF